jgi:hypothetical protein
MPSSPIALLRRSTPPAAAASTCTATSIPYDWATNPLRFLLPTWLHEGGVSATLERLARRCPNRGPLVAPCVWYT